MGKYANYMILPEFRLILECCKGMASVEDAINMKKDELSDVLYNPDFNIIVDFREFETNIDSTIKTSTKNFFEFLKGLDMNCKIAILTKVPHQVVISILLKELSANLLSINIEVFSTLEAALTFLGLLANDSDLITNKIIELNKTTGSM
jgi:hypothetical protein